MNKLVVFVALVGAACISQAKTCHWSGLGSDNLWTNSNNWVEGEVPGLYGVSSGSDTDDAIFGPVAAGAHTTIDLDGQWCVSNLSFTAGAPAYTFGTSSSQNFGLTTCGNIVIESGVVNTQTFACATKFGYAGSNEKIPSRIYNNGSGLMDFRGGWNSAYNHWLYFYGAGDFRVCDRIVTNHGRIRLYCDGVFHFESTGDESKLKAVGPDKLNGTSSLRRIDLPNQDSKITWWDGGEPAITCSFAENTIVSGQGTFGFYNSHPSNVGTTGIVVSVSAGKKATFDANVAYGARPGLIYVTASGTGIAQFNGSATGIHTDFRINTTTTLSVEKLGTVGCDAAETSIGPSVSQISFLGAGFLEYIGSGESTDRALKVASANTGTVRNAGSGALTLTGDMSATVGGAKLCFNADTAPIIVDGAVSQAYPLVASIAGGNTVTFARECEFSSLSMDGGNLVVGAAVSSLPAMSMTSGNSAVVVPAGKSLTVASVSSTSGTVDFRTGDGASVYITAAADVPASVMLNGAPAKRESDGLLTQKLSKWASAVDGNWQEVAKWDNGIPGEGWGSEISASGDSYVVTVDSALPAVPQAIAVANETADATATLQFDTPIGFTNKVLTIGAGGVLSASAGLVVTNTVNGAGSFSIQTGGKVRVTGGMFQSPASKDDIGYDGGTLEIAGEAEAMFPETAYFRTGETVFDGNGKLSRRGTKGMLRVQPNRAGETAALTFKAARANHPLRGSTLLVGGVPSGTATVNFSEPDPEKEGTVYHGGGGNPPEFTAIGYYSGVGVMNVSGGQFQSGHHGIHVGSTYYYNSGVNISTDIMNVPTGIVEVTGGSLKTMGTWGCFNKFPCGLIVGDASAASVLGMQRAVGIMYVKGGKILPNGNFTIIGSGHAEGALIQTGGEMTHNADYTNSSYPRPNLSTNYRYPFVVGLAGGLGTYVISNGTLTVNAKNSVFVGGASEDDLQWANGYSWTDNGFPIDSLEGKGLFAVRGGTVSIGASMYLGCAGTGELEIGPAGSFSVGGDLVLSNNVSSVLRVVLGPSGVPNATVNGRLVITDGAHLVVDMSSFELNRGWTRLLNPVGGIEGSFAPENVTVILPESSSLSEKRFSVCTSRNGESGLWLSLEKGMIITFR